MDSDPTARYARWRLPRLLFRPLWAAFHALVRAAATARLSGSAIVLRRLSVRLRREPSELHANEQ